MKSNKDNGPLPIKSYKWTQFLVLGSKVPHYQKLFYFSLSTMSKKGTMGLLPTLFFHFLPTKEPWHPSKVAFTEDNTTQETPKRDNKSPHSHNVEKCNQPTLIQKDRENIYLLYPSSSLELIKSQYFSPRRLPSKKYTP